MWLCASNVQFFLMLLDEVHAWYMAPFFLFTKNKEVNARSKTPTQSKNKITIKKYSVHAEEILGKMVSNDLLLLSNYDKL